MWFYTEIETETTATATTTRDYISKKIQSATVLSVRFCIVIHLMRVYGKQSIPLSRTNVRPLIYKIGILYGYKREQQIDKFLELLQIRAIAVWKTLAEMHSPEIRRWDSGQRAALWFFSANEVSVRSLISRMHFTNELNVAENEMNFPQNLNCSAEREQHWHCAPCLCVFVHAFLWQGLKMRTLCTSIVCCCCECTIECKLQKMHTDTHDKTKQNSEMKREKSVAHNGKYTLARTKVSRNFVC